MAGPENADYSGILSKKKLEHSRFEDAYKPKVQCWLKKNVLYMRPLGADRNPMPGSIPEKLDMSIWKARPFFGSYFVWNSD